MPGCVLRVAGSKEKIKKFLSTSSLKPDLVYFKGDRKSSKSVWTKSGFNLLLSNADGIQKQAAGVARFISMHKTEFEHMKTLGFKGSTIDFGLYPITTEEHFWPTYKLPKSLILLAATYGCEIELSFYSRP